MLCLAISRNSVRYVRVEDKNFSWQDVEYINKVPLPFEISPCDANFSSSQLENVIETIVDDERISKDEVLLSLPVELGNYKVYSVDEELEKDVLSQFLEFCEKKRLGKLYDGSLVQFYPLGGNKFFGISFPEKFLELVIGVLGKFGLKPRLVDINLISSLYGVERIYNTASLSSWALSLVCDRFQVLAFMKKNKLVSLSSFILLEGEGYEILAESDPNEELLSVIRELDRMRFSPTARIRTVEKLFVYSYDVYSDYFNTFLTYRVDNIEVVDPFVKFKPRRLYDRDGDGAGAMSQFIDVVGLLYRFYYGEI